MGDIQLVLDDATSDLRAATGVGDLTAAVALQSSDRALPLHHVQTVWLGKLSAPLRRLDDSVPDDLCISIRGCVCESVCRCLSLVELKTICRLAHCVALSRVAFFCCSGWRCSLHPLASFDLQVGDTDTRNALALDLAALVSSRCDRVVPVVRPIDPIDAGARSAAASTVTTTAIATLSSPAPKAALAAIGSPTTPLPLPAQSSSMPFASPTTPAPPSSASVNAYATPPSSGVSTASSTRLMLPPLPPLPLSSARSAAGSDHGNR
jgi:hypothetical protein